MTREHPFLRRSVHHAETLLAELSEQRTEPGRMDPRVKLLGSLVLLVALALLHSPLLLTAAAAGLVVCSIITSTWRTLVALAAPVLAFTAVLLVPATLSVVRPGTVVVALWTSSGVPQGLTDAGLRNAWIVLARVLSCLAVAVLLTRTTSWLRLMSSLRTVGAPAAFVMIATMANRYLAVLLDGFIDLLLARRARSVGGATWREDQSFVGGTIGALYVRSNELADQVHQAMVARGFTGRLADPAPRPLRLRDLLLGAATVLAAVALLWGDVLVR